MAEEDLDAELALFEQEIEETEATDDANENQTAVPLASTDADKLQKSAFATEGSKNGGTIVASSEAVTVNPQPEWQRELLQRDAERIQAQTANTRERTDPPALPANGSKPVDANTAEVQTARQPSAPPGIGNMASASSAVAMGGWVWNGYQWVWDPAAPSNHGNDWDGGSHADGQGGVGPAESSSRALDELGTNRGRGSGRHHKRKSGNVNVRTAAGNVWVDPSLNDWPEDDFRIFVGDLAPDATEEELKQAFMKYSSYNMARVVVDKRTGEGKGYGFVSFGKGEDMVAALKEMNGKYVGSRPVKLRKSTWQKRELTTDRRRDLKVFKGSGLVQKQRRKK